MTELDDEHVLLSHGTIVQGLTQRHARSPFFNDALHRFLRFGYFNGTRSAVLNDGYKAGAEAYWMRKHFSITFFIERARAVE